jgi:hypothetical protein
MSEQLELSSGGEPLEQRSERDGRGRFAKGNSHRWVKGESGNAAGRRDAMSDTLRRKLNEQHDYERTRREAVIDALIDEAVNGSVRAAELIFQRLEGKMPTTKMIDVNISRSEYQLYEMRVTELQEIAEARGTPISRGKAIRLLGVADPRVVAVLGEGENE